MEFFKEILGKIWYILYPLLFYYAVMLIIMTIAQWAFGGDATHYVFCQLIATVFTIPSMLPFYRQGQALAGIAKQPFGISRERICHALFAAGIMACFGISLNNLISMTKLTEISMGYQQANTDFYGSTIGMEILCLAVFTPILEELVFRGILFGRLKDMLSKPFAVGISALIFAAVHVNIVQFIYALILGVVLALLMDRAGNVYASMIGHMTANFIAVVRTETHWLDFSVRGDAVSWIFSLVVLGAGIVLMWRYLSDRKKQEDKEKE